MRHGDDSSGDEQLGPHAGDPLADLAKGFDYLTLNPGPRLREFRSRQTQRDAFIEAWTIVGKAMREALKMIMQRSSIE